VPHKLIEFAKELFCVPSGTQNIITGYFGNLYTCFTLEGYILGWQQLECGIVMGCAIFPILFVLGFEVIPRWALLLR